MKSRILIAAGVVMAAIIIGVLAWRQTHVTEPLLASGVVEMRRIEAGSKAGGRVTEVLVAEGTRVDAGVALVRFDVEQLAAQLAQARATVAEAEARLRQLQRGLRPEEVRQSEAAAAQAKQQFDAARNGPRPQEIDQARAELRAAQSTYQNALTSFDRQASLHRTGDISQQVYDDAAARRDNAKAQMQAAEERVRLLEAGTRKEDIAAARNRYEQAALAADLARQGTRIEEIEQARARVEQARAQVRQLDVQYAEGEIKAPSRCLVESLAVRPGDLVGPNKTVVTLLEADQSWVRAYVPEPQLGRWQVGQPVQVSLDSDPQRWLRAHVEQISTIAEFLPRNIQTRDDRALLMFGMKVRLDEGQDLLRSGMAASVRLANQ